MKDSNYCQLCNVSKTGYPIEKTNLSYIFDLLIDLKNCIYWFGKLWVSKCLKLLRIKKVYNKIAFAYPNCQKTFNLLDCNYK